MGSRGSGSGNSSYGTYAASTNFTSSGTMIQPQVAVDASMATQANNAAFKATDNSAFHELYNGRQYYQNQSFDIDTLIAIQSA